VLLHIVRHGSAGVRNDDDPADTERHLDATGVRQAVHLAKRLTVASPDDVEGHDPLGVVLASPAARCIETVEPLAASAGVDLGIDDRLFEGTDIERSWGLVEELARAGENAVLCSHGDVIPDLIRRAKGRGMEIWGKSGCSKGSLWTLTWDGERFITGTYEPNPG